MKTIFLLISKVERAIDLKDLKKSQFKTSHENSN